MSSNLTVATMKKKCVSCFKEKNRCVDLGANAWCCWDCLKPASQSLANDIDKQILEELLAQAKNDK